MEIQKWSEAGKKTMEKMIREIYTEIIQNPGYEYSKYRKNVEKKIEKLLEEEKKRMDWREYEKCRGKAFDIGYIAEEAGFVKGFQYAVMLLTECFPAQEP